MSKGSKHALLYYSNMEVQFHPGTGARGTTGTTRRRTNNSKRTNVYSGITVDKFVPYSGSRWQIPSGIKITDSVRFKFNRYDSFEKSEILRVINQCINVPSSTFIFYRNDFVPWKHPQFVASYLQRVRDLESNEWKKVKNIYLRIFKITRYLKKLVHNYRVNKALKNKRNTEDPVTLEIPKKPVYVVDLKNRCSHVYDASTLRKTIHNKILYSDYMFPYPSQPVNMLTNIPFTYGQLISIYKQCAAHGEFSWAFDRYRSCGYDLINFEKRFRQQLKIEAVEYFFKNQRDLAKDVVIDYFLVHADNEEMPLAKIAAFKRRYNKRPDSIVILNWIQLARRYYINLELRNLEETIRLTKDTSDMLESTYHSLD